MTTTGTNPTIARPPIVDRQTWLHERDQLLAREKAHTREGDAIAAARRRLPMTLIAAATVQGPNGDDAARRRLRGAPDADRVLPHVA